jgi:hypothetical protein
MQCLLVWIECRDMGDAIVVGGVVRVSSGDVCLQMAGDVTHIEICVSGLGCRLYLGRYRWIW